MKSLEREDGTTIRFEYIGDMVKENVIKWAIKNKIDLIGASWKICDENMIEIHVTPQKIMYMDAKEPITEFIKKWTKINGYNFDKTTWKIFEPEIDSLNRQTKNQTGIEIHIEPQNKKPEAFFYLNG